MSSINLVQGPSTGGNKNRVFIREGCNQPWNAWGCIGVQGVSENTSNTYSHCYAEDGTPQTRAFSQVQDPTDLTLTSRGNARALSMFRTLTKLANNGCYPEVLLASMDCESALDVTKPVKGDLFVKLRLGPGAVQYGNNTFRSLDATQTAAYEYQATLAQLAVEHFARPNIKKLSGYDAAGDILSLAIFDQGTCADGICNDCGGAGCLLMGAVTDVPSWQWNVGGGNAAWTTLAALDVGHAAAINISQVRSIDGRPFFTGAGVSLAAIDPVTGLPTFTAWNVTGAGGAVVSPTAPFSNAVKLADGNIGIGGAENAYFVSKDGVNFVRVKGQDGGAFNMLRQCVAANGTIFALCHDDTVGDERWKIMYSEDNGRSWTTMLPSPIAVGGTPLEGALATTAADIWCAGNEAHVVIGGHHFLTGCGTSPTADKGYRRLNIAGAALTNIGSCDPSCDAMFAINVSGGVATIKWTVDGFSAADATDILATISNASAIANAMACCNVPQGPKTVFAVGPALYEARTWDNVFDEPLTGV